MQCDSARGKLQQVLDNQLPAEEMQAIQLHVQNCTMCRNELALLCQVDDALATFPVRQEPAGLTARVMDHIRASKAAAQPTSRLVFPLPWQDILVSFGGALAITAVLLIFSRLEQGAPPIKLASYEVWRIWNRNLGRLWHLARMEPALAAWGVSSLCATAASMVGIVVSVQRWPNRWPKQLAILTKKR
ncbi:MAG: hypothetical protein JXA89_00525 [Anaerolineae bacterium]|nr:hypothetical protein [Anaerolineae bacterium]